MASQLTPSHTRVLATMDLEKEEMRIKLLHSKIQSLLVGNQFQNLDVSLDLTNSPLGRQNQLAQASWEDVLQ